MALKVTFGNGGAASVSSLTNLVDQEAYKLLTESTAQVKNGSSLDSGVVNVGAVSVPGTGAGGTVDVGYDPSSNGFKFDVSSAWNSVKNALAQSDTSENLTFKDFVQVDVHLGGTGSSTVEVLNAKRGNISTGVGNDTVTVSVISNDKAWVNAFNIDTGAGNDTIVVKAGTAFDGGVAAGTNVVNGGAGVTDGSFTSVKIDAGASAMTLIPKVPLPFQERLARERRAEGLGSRQTGEAQPSLQVVTPYLMFTRPSFDVSIDTSASNSTPRQTGRFEVRAAGDLARAGLQVFAGSDEHWTLNNVRILLDRKDPDALMLCAMAKRFGTDVGFEVANQALQLHGGYGYLAEYGIEKIVRDLRVHQILEGTNEIMRLIVARKLIGDAR